MIQDNQIITIQQAKHIGDYKIELQFNDQMRRTVDFYPFLSKSNNPLIRKYLDQQEFSKFEVENGDLEWNDYDLCFPIADLYEDRILKSL